MSSGLISPGSWQGERFELQGRLGEGAFGEVFRAYDRRLKTVVALKTLTRVDAAALYHFKREFRALAGVHHRNLVQLYELLSVGERWFFTMELVEGRDFLEYAGLDATLSTIDTRGLESSAPEASGPSSLRRLRGALRQLTAGLLALHRAGKLHRDIKPSNIHVTPEGRLVLLDFGLVKELAVPEVFDTSVGEVLGTPAYMSPEQAAGKPVTEASDWYSAGCVLFEALTGERPFVGSLGEVLRGKTSREAPAPRDLDPTVPPDLNALCHQLIARDPARRPSGEQVLKRLGEAGRVPKQITVAQPVNGFSLSRREGLPFVGRVEELAALDQAFEATRQGRAVAVFVHGGSGLGKTALIDRFMTRVRDQHPEAVVLSGRCHEREAVPYKGLDPLVDTLSAYLKQLPPTEAEELISGDVWALVRLFPALERVPAVAQASRDVLELPNLHEQRRQARRALRGLLRRLADRRPTLLFIDDLQWSDRDSANLLAHVLAPPDPPAILLVTSDRRGGRDEKPLLQQLLSSGPSADSPEVREIEVGRLSFAEVSELGRLLFDDPSSAQALVRALARESRGSPLFMAELVRYARSERGREEGEMSFFGPGIPLENLIWSRLERLSPAARRMMDVVAVAGRPVAFEVVIEAADLGNEGQAAVTELLAANLICLRGDRQQELESYHDRIRETTLQGLDPAGLKRLHLQLATAFEAGGWADAETLAMHFHAAGDRDRAAELAVAAARLASEALAFDRAVRLYRLALDLEVDDAAARHGLEVALADALAQVGRSPEAADAYLVAAAGAGGTEALELERRAAVQQRLSGSARDAFATTCRLLLAVGIRTPRTRLGMFLAFVGLRLYLNLRGLGFHRRDAVQIPAEQLFRIDACWTGAGASIEAVPNLAFVTRHLLLALRAGEPRRIIRGLLPQVYSQAGSGRRTRRSSELIQLALRLAKSTDDPHSLGYAKYTAGLAAFFEGRWKRAGELLERTEVLLRQGPVDWEWTSVILWQMEILCWRGHFQTLLDRLPTVLKEVAERGDLLLEYFLRSRVGWRARLAEDRPDAAVRELREADQRLTPDLDHYRFLQLHGEVSIALYRGDGPAALASLEKGWPQWRRSGVLKARQAAIHMLHLRSRTTLATAIAGEEGAPENRGLHRQIHKDLRRIEKHRLGWGDPLARLVRAGLETLRRRREPAIDHLAAAEAGFESADMELYAAVSRRQRGRLLGPERGERLVQEADRWMAKQGIRNPARMADALAPGVWSVA